MSWDYRTDPLCRWLLAESADLEWQRVEDEFQADLQRVEAAPVPVIDQARDAMAMLLRSQK